jgi:hypothetical protein
MTVRRRTRVYDSWGKHCGARKRQPAYDGETCQRPAGWGTWHPGVGRCKLHGGARGYKHGRYSRVAREHLRPAVQRQLADYSIQTIYTALRARIHDDDRLNDVLWYVFEEAGLLSYLDLEDETPTATGANERT